MQKYAIKGINSNTNEQVFEVIDYPNDIVALIESGMFALIRGCYENYSLYRINADKSTTKIELN